jgi:hypothetical protein
MPPVLTNSIFVNAKNPPQELMVSAVCGACLYAMWDPVPGVKFDWDERARRIVDVPTQRGINIGGQGGCGEQPEAYRNPDHFLTQSVMHGGLVIGWVGRVFACARTALCVLSGLNYGCL